MMFSMGLEKGGGGGEAQRGEAFFETRPCNRQGCLTTPHGCQPTDTDPVPDTAAHVRAIQLAQLETCCEWCGWVSGRTHGHMCGTFE